MFFSVSFSASANDELVDLNFQFTVVENVSITFSVSSGGYANIQYTVSAKQSDSMVIKTYIEQRYMGIFWRRVNIGNFDNEWVVRVNSKFSAGSNSAVLTENGTYRAKIEVYIGSDKIVASSSECYFERNILFCDANGDGRITAADARIVLRCAAKLEKYSSEQKEMMDLDSNGKINAADARIVLLISASLSKV